MRKPKFQIFVGKNDQFYFRLRAANNEVILTSEGYSSKQGCKNGIASVKKNAPLDQRYQQKESANGKHYFVLVAANGQAIGSSQMYSTEQSRNKGIDAVKRAASEAEIVENS
jgi:uncharacterized protein YegP (UPF0339 family)